MTETVVKTIENIDELFSQIVVNGEVHQSTRYVPPVATQTQTSSPSQGTQTSTATETGSDTPVRQTQGQDIYGVELNDVLHDFVDQRVTQALEEEVTARENAETQLQTNIDNEEMARQQADYGLGQRITTIEEVIPNQATPSNQLADKAFVNSSIATNTANFLGTYTSLADIEAIPNPTNNDYAYLETTDTAGNTLYDRYKYSAEDEQWLFEYELNNSSFTAEQWATINSGLTQSSVSSDISSAIEALDVSAIGGSGKYIKQISQTDGKITAVTGNITSSITSGSNDPVTSGAVADALANITVTDAVTAEKLKTARNLKVSLSSSNAQSFDGSANAESIGVSGTLPATNGGTGQTSLDDVTVGISKGVDVAENTQVADLDTVTISADAFISDCDSGTANKPSGTSIGTALTLYAGYQSALPVTNSKTRFIQMFFAGASKLYTRVGTRPLAGQTITWGTWNKLTFDGDVNASSMSIPVTCSTAGAESAKTVALEGFNLVKGAHLLITMANANTSASAITMNVNSTGAKTIRWNGTVTSASAYAMTADTYACYYDGTYWNMDNAREVYSARTASGCSGNSSTADTTRGTAYCTTAGDTQAKVASMRGYVLQNGATFPITFTNANSYNGVITLNVNSTGAKNVYINGAVTSSSNKTLPAGTYLCRYNGSYYYIDTSYFVTNARNANYASSAGSATTANKIRTSAPSSPSDGDIWIE